MDFFPPELIMASLLKVNLNLNKLPSVSISEWSEEHLEKNPSEFFVYFNALLKARIYTQTLLLVGPEAWSCSFSA